MNTANVTPEIIAKAYADLNNDPKLTLTEWVKANPIAIEFLAMGFGTVRLETKVS